ncbi:sugar transferase [Sphingomonas koreensis]|nr:sugar transferase [Sphingomonas koreensis]
MSVPAVVERRIASRRLLRAIDILGAGVALILFLPVLVIIAGIVSLERRGPILFRHERIGLQGQTFRCLKFRTMVADAEERLQEVLASCPDQALAWMRDQKLANDPRITPLGRLLRVSSLDEMPQLWNVLVGEMSLVGPRPITEAEIVRYGRYFCDYVCVKPGITGLWQISGRNNVSYRRRVAMDVAFSRSQSVALVLKILALTPIAVLFARGSG